MDESPKQLISETRVPIPASPGRADKHDYEYKRCCKSNIFLACEPLAGKRMVKVTERRTVPRCFVWVDPYMSPTARSYDWLDFWESVLYG
jgi:hypothetical protein